MKIHTDIENQITKEECKTKCFDTSEKTWFMSFRMLVSLYDNYEYYN